jgi:hypothetical protein
MMKDHEHYTTAHQHPTCGIGRITEDYGRSRITRGGTFIIRIEGVNALIKVVADATRGHQERIRSEKHLELILRYRLKIGNILIISVGEMGR